MDLRIVDCPLQVRGPGSVRTGKVAEPGARSGLQDGHEIEFLTMTEGRGDAGIRHGSGRCDEGDAGALEQAGWFTGR
jgi:hypothetical protein